MRSKNPCIFLPYLQTLGMQEHECTLIDIRVTRKQKIAHFTSNWSVPATSYTNGGRDALKTPSLNFAGQSIEFHTIINCIRI